MSISTLSDDEWSHIMSFICSDQTPSRAWDTAMDIVNISQTCHSWQERKLWKYWASSYHIFSFDKFPSVLYPFMSSANENDGRVMQKSAVEHLKLSASSLANLPRKTVELGRKRYMYLYEIEDVLQVATAKYGCIAVLEQHILKCAQRVESRERNRQLKEDRQKQVNAVLTEIGARFMINREYPEIIKYVDKGKGTLEVIRDMALDKKRIYDEMQAQVAAKHSRRQQVNAILTEIGAQFMIYGEYPEITKYIDKGEGTLEVIREMALEKKRIYDEKQAQEVAKHSRRNQVHLWAGEVELHYPQIYERNSVILDYIHSCIGYEGTVKQALIQERDLREERQRLSEQNAPSRRAELLAELGSQRMALRSDSRFCKHYIMGETNASVQEVVATMKLTSYLFNYGHRTWSNWHGTMECAMRDEMRKGNFTSWYAAYNHVINTHDVEESDDEFDYY